jgi:hypothetical protein
MHPLRNDFGSVAVVAPVLLQSSEADNYSAAAAQAPVNTSAPRRSEGCRPKPAATPILCGLVSPQFTRGGHFKS